VNNDKLNQWLATLANFGVVIGIIFLVIEIRQTSMQIEQNTAAISGEAFFKLNENSSASKIIFAQDAELAAIVLKGNEDPVSLTEVERARYIDWTRARFNFLEAYWVYRRKGLIDDSDSAGMQGSICDTFAVKGTRWSWENHPGNYTAGFRKDVEQLCFQ